MKIGFLFLFNYLNDFILFLHFMAFQSFYTRVKLEYWGLKRVPERRESFIGSGLNTHKRKGPIKF
jgi:hypothetical protein